jgi:tetratricopeptide (TPR) repeat protein
VAAVRQWTGREARALRHALRMPLREFAARLGVGERTVSKWEALGSATIPRPVWQAALDTKLRESDEEVHVRFQQNLVEPGGASPKQMSSACVATIDYDWWTDDLDRSLISLGRQEFRSARQQIDRWIRRFTLNSNDIRGMQLYGRSLRLLGDIQADQGILAGVQSAQTCYQTALEVFVDLKMPRRVAQIELQLTVVDEMSGRLRVAADQYRKLATDDRLDQLDRTRAQLWIGTALSKLDQNDAAVGYIRSAILAFDALGEADDWSVAHQKLALAYRGAGELKGASRHIDIALANQQREVPMQRVRLHTAHAHILLSDVATRADGLEILAETARLAARYELRHQLQSIEGIRTKFEREQCP